MTTSKKKLSGQNRQGNKKRNYLLWAIILAIAIALLGLFLDAKGCINQSNQGSVKTSYSFADELVWLGKERLEGAKRKYNDMQLWERLELMNENAVALDERMGELTKLCKTYEFSPDRDPAYIDPFNSLIVATNTIYLVKETNERDINEHIEIANLTIQMVRNCEELIEALSSIETYTNDNNIIDVAHKTKWAIEETEISCLYVLVAISADFENYLESLDKIKKKLQNNG